jgi:hypothetical protein
VSADDGGEDVLLGAGGPWRLPAVTFEADPASPTAAWRVGSREGDLALHFTPTASHREARELLLLSSRTTRLTGELTGSVPGPDGTPLEVARWPAVVESVEARS